MQSIIGHTKTNINPSIVHSSTNSQSSKNKPQYSPLHGSDSMDTINDKLQIEADAILRTLNRNQRAMLKRIQWFNTNGYHQCCFETVEQMGSDLSKWGGKDVKRTQALEAYRAIRRLINAEQPHHKARYRRTFNQLGLVVIQLIEQAKTKPDTQVFKTRHPKVAKPDTLNTQKPTLLNSLKVDKTKTKEKEVKFTNHVNDMLDSLDEDLSYKAIEEYKAYIGSTPVTHPSLVMEKIAAKHVATQAFRDDQRAMEKRRAKAMLEQAEDLKRSLDSIDIGDKQYRMDMAQRFKEQMRANLGR